MPSAPLHEDEGVMALELPTKHWVDDNHKFLTILIIYIYMLFISPSPRPANRLIHRARGAHATSDRPNPTRARMGRSPHALVLANRLRMPRAD
jgi:hypothetical protein